MDPPLCNSLHREATSRGIPRDIIDGSAPKVVVHRRIDDVRSSERFAVEGANVAVLSRSRDKVDAAVERLRAQDIADTRYGGYVADVREYDAVVAALADWHARCGPIDILILGAAGNFLAPVEALSPRACR